MLLLVYGITLLVAVLLSERFNRTVLSAAVLFLIVGLAIGPAALGLVRLAPGDAWSGASATERLSACCSATPCSWDGPI